MSAADGSGHAFPMPVPDRDSAPWWAAVARQELQAQACAECGALRWPARALCNRCGSLEWSWRPLSGRATVASWVVNRHAFGRPGVGPYTVVLARLDEQDDLLVPGAWGGDPAGTDVAIGLPVRVGYHEATTPDGEGPPVTLLRWTAAEEGRGT